MIREKDNKAAIGENDVWLPTVKPIGRFHVLLFVGGNTRLDCCYITIREKETDVSEASKINHKSPTFLLTFNGSSAIKNVH